jgi:hypothetical protein
MGFTEKKWRVKIKTGDSDLDKRLDGTFFSVDWTQVTDNSFSTADWVFQISNIGGDGVSGGHNTDKIHSQLGKATKFNFTVEDISGSDKGTEQKHSIATANFHFSKQGSGSTLRVLSIENKAKLLLPDKNRALEHPSLDLMVRQLLGESGLKPEKIEICDKIPEFKILRQVNISNYGQIVNEINPRAITKSGEAGFRLFTSDGEKCFWGPIGMSGGTRTPEKEQVVDVNDIEKGYSVVVSKAMARKTIGFDMLKKKLVVADTGPDVSPSLGSQDVRSPWSSAKALDYFPMGSEEALKAYNNRLKYWERYSAFPALVNLRGSTGYDDPPFSLELPGDSYKDAGSKKISGWVQQIQHKITQGEYTMGIVLLRDKASS